ncbi:hypothetical protein H4R23_000093 [Coemansia sp. Cherry 401B]|nr:hypothetical protein H4R23_000093 [Coemansia sp. Cherry 401B]
MLLETFAPAAAALLAWKLSPLRSTQAAHFSSFNFHGGDNRLWMGPALVIVLCVQVLVQALAAWCQLSSKTPGPLPGLASAILLLQWIAAAAVATRQLLAYLWSIRHKHYGLFSRAVLAFVAASLGANLVQAYYAFFIPVNWKTPAWGAGVSSQDVLLEARLCLNILAMALLLTVRRLPRYGLAYSRLAVPKDTERLIGHGQRAASYSMPPERRLSPSSAPRLPSAEIGNSILDNTLFTWVGDLIAVSKQRQPQLDDLYEPPRRYLQSESWSRFKASAHRRRSLVSHLAAAFKPEILAQVALNPLCVVLDYAQPFLMQRFLRFIATYTDDPSSGLRFGFFLATCMLLVNLAANILQQQQDWSSRTLFMHFRNVLITMLARKSMRRRAKSGNGQPGTADKGVSDGRVYNVLTSDILRLFKFIKLVRAAMVVPFQLLIGAFYMERLLGVAGILGTFMLVAVVYLTRRLITRSKQIESQLGKVNDRRLAVITEVIQGISSVKLMGWKTRFVGIIGERRAEQLAIMWKRARVASLINLCTVGSLPFVIFATFAVYSLQHSLNAETIFTAFAIFKIIQRTVDSLPSLVTDSTAFIVAFQRIESFLAQQEVQPLEDRVDDIDNVDALGFKGATLEWNSESEFALQNLDLQFPSGKLTLIGGPTGSGKSSLLSALVGDMELVQGSVMAPVRLAIDENLHNVEKCTILNDIAYVSQEPWLRNGTVRENILFGEPFQQQRYETVLHMCALLPDLALFPANDATEIGERGITLSGGQRQRVALARAVYSLRKILLIDDCLSAVDAHTAKHILHQCLLSRNELMAGRTRVLVTHHLALCLPHADYVVTVKNGQISFQGTPDEAVVSSESQLCGIDISESSSSGATSSTEDNDNDANDAEYLASNAVSLQASRSTTMSATTMAAYGKLIKDEVRARGVIRLDTWKMYFTACGGQWFALLCFGYVMITQLLAMYKDYYLAAKMSDSDSHRHSSGEMHWLVIYLGFGVLSAIVSSLGLLVAYVGSQRASAILHEQLVDSILSAKMRWLETNPIGRSIARFGSDMQSIDDSVMPGLTNVIRPLMTLLISLVVISLTVPMFIFVGLVVLALYAHYTWQFMQIQRETKRLDSIAFAPIISLFSEIISGSTPIRAFAMESAFMDEMKKRFAIYYSAEFVRRSTSRWMRVRVGIVSSVMTFITASFILARIDTISSGLAGFILLQTVGFLQDTIVVVRKYSDVEMALAAVERVHQYLDIDHEAPSLKVTDSALPVGWPNTGNLEVSNLVTGYTSDTPILHELSFSIKHGDRIGVVGRTGAGKSSLTLALLRLIEATSGQIVLDGVDIALVGLETLRQNVTIIPQNPVLFNGSIRFNLDPFGDYPDSLLLDALSRTLLLKDSDSEVDSVAAFSSLDDMVMSHGQNLSLGQRQLVALARALVRRSRLVVLDEATAAVDFKNDSRIQRTIRGPEFANATLLCIAHRLRTIIDYDRILVLNEGKIVEFDTPLNLIQREGGHFRQLCENSNEFALLQKLALGMSAIE